MEYELQIDDQGKPYLAVNITDYTLLTNSLLNKGMSFTNEEREAFGLLGLIPPYEADLASQRERSLLAFHSKPTDLEKYIYLRDLQESNETLFYSLILNNIEKMLPIVYTPTVGLGCERFSHVYRRARGVFIAYPYRDRIDKILANKRFDKVKVIVVSDGERILGLGDQGAGGMGIPIGKLALYTACAGIYPRSTLPILLDTGTNNKALLEDPLYIGWRHERVRGPDYEEFIHAFVTAVEKHFPHVLIQWEDFAQVNANPILERYRNEICTFNDDIQGTAAVAVGTLLAAIRVTGIPLAQQRIVIVGAGSAGVGIGNLILRKLTQEGIAAATATKCFYLVDRQGLITTGMAALPFQEKFVQPKTLCESWQRDESGRISLAEVIRQVHPTLLIGVSGQPNLFTEEIVREMAKHVERPIIFPLSNPTSQAEATPADLLRWTNERALIGTGSPFPEILKKGRLTRVDQTNNCYIFPGLGLALIAVKAKIVTDNMFLVAAEALAELSPTKNNLDASLLPPLADIRAISLKVAVAVAKEAINEDLAGFIPPIDLEEYLARYMWMPAYLPYKLAK